MENWLDYLFPVIVVLFYALSRLFGPKEDEGDEEPGAPRPFQQQTEEDQRARELREEIQRKIAERRAAENGESETQPTTPAPRQQPQRRPAPQRQRQQPQPVVTSRRDHAQSRSFEDYENEIQTKLKQIEATELKADAIRQSGEVGDFSQEGSPYSKTRRVARTDVRSLSGRAVKAVSTISPYATRSSAQASEEIRGARALLKSPRSARQAVMLREILDTPVGYRRGEDRSRGPVE